MKRRNPGPPHRQSSWKNTEIRIEQYRGKCALLETWEKQPDEVQAENHDYIIQLRQHVRQVRNYLLHRADVNAKII